MIGFSEIRNLFKISLWEWALYWPSNLSRFKMTSVLYVFASWYSRNVPLFCLVWLRFRCGWGFYICIRLFWFYLSLLVCLFIFFWSQSIVKRACKVHSMIFSDFRIYSPQIKTWSKLNMIIWYYCMHKSKRLETHYIPINFTTNIKH